MNEIGIQSKKGIIMTNKQWDEKIKQVAKEVIDNMDELDKRLFTISNSYGSTTYTVYKCLYKNFCFTIKHSKSGCEIIGQCEAPKRIVDRAIDLIESRY